MSSNRRRSARSSLTAAPPSLPVIPEMDTPGGNAWAQREVEQERYQLAGNAFAQRQFSEQKMTPPGVVHPAFRKGFNLLDTTKPIPELDSPDRGQNTGPHQRESSLTTMTQFMQPSPELNLGTTPDATPNPTQREWLETRDHLEMHGNKPLHIPVFKHTPKNTAAEFSSSTRVEKKDDAKLPPHTPATTSPRKGFFERLSKWTARLGQPQTPKQDAEPQRSSGSHLPPKARAVLQEAPPPRSIIRSPSKAKSFFSRQPFDLNAKRLETPRAATSLGHRTPQVVHFATPRSSVQDQESASKAAVTPCPPNLGRSQSLKYLDQAIPPTPPAKDTPPDELAIRNISSQRPFVPFTNETPSKTSGFVSTSGKLSPTQKGSYGNRGAAQLVTQPSMYSMRASVVPEAMDKDEFDDAKSRLGALGIEGFSLPRETHRGNKALTYSPSIYSTEGFRSPLTPFPERAARLSASDRYGVSQPSTNDRTETMQLRGSPSAAQSSSSDTGIIPMVYPELAKDPSIASFMTPDLISSPPQPGAAERAFHEVENMLNIREQLKMDSPIKMPQRRRRSSTSTVRDDHTRVTPESARSELSTEGLFAIPLKRVQRSDGGGPSQSSPGGQTSLEQTSTKQAPPETPSTVRSSPMAHHPSAMPSPLRTGSHFLPPTTYTPTQPRSRKEAKKPLKISTVEERGLNDALLSPYEPPWTPGGRPKPKEDIFKNMPSLTPPVGESLVVRHSPPIGGSRWSKETTTASARTGDPKKPFPTRQTSSGKSVVVETAPAAAMEQRQQHGPQAPLPEEPGSVEFNSSIIEIITDRDDKIRDLHKKMETETTRLHQRLASLEIYDRMRTSKPEVCYGGGGQRHETTTSNATQTDDDTRSSVDRRAAKRSQHQQQQHGKKRISTAFARDYYQKQESSEATTTSTPMSEERSRKPAFPQLLSQEIPDLPPPAAELPREDSPTLPPGSPGPVVVNFPSSTFSSLPSSSSPPGGQALAPRLLAEPSTLLVPSAPTDSGGGGGGVDPRIDDLMTVVQKQQTTILEMMQEIKDLKRAGNHGGSRE